VSGQVILCSTRQESRREILRNTKFNLKTSTTHAHRMRKALMTRGSGAGF